MTLKESSALFPKQNEAFDWFSKLEPLPKAKEHYTSEGKRYIFLSMLTVLASNPSTNVWAIVGSILATGLVFLLIRLAKIVRKIGEVDVVVRRMAELNPKEVKLNVLFGNADNKDREFSSFSLCKKEGKKWICLSTLQEDPIQIDDGKGFLIKDGDGWKFHISRQYAHQVTLDFVLPQKEDEVYLVCYEGKKRRKAKINLTHFNEQSFRL